MGTRIAAFLILAFSLAVPTALAASPASIAITSHSVNADESVLTISGEAVAAVRQCGNCEDGDPLTIDWCGDSLRNPAYQILGSGIGGAMTPPDWTIILSSQADAECDATNTATGEEAVFTKQINIATLCGTFTVVASVQSGAEVVTGERTITLARACSCNAQPCGPATTCGASCDRDGFDPLDGLPKFCLQINGLWGWYYVNPQHYANCATFDWNGCNAADCGGVDSGRKMASTGKWLFDSEEVCNDDFIPYEVPSCNPCSSFTGAYNTRRALSCAQADCWDNCKAGSSQCNGNWIEQCVLQASGCYKWSATSQCPANTVCQATGTPPSTTANCVCQDSRSNATVCGAKTCGTASDNCGAARTCGTCTAGNVCQSGTCVPGCGGDGASCTAHTQCCTGKWCDQQAGPGRCCPEGRYWNGTQCRSNPGCSPIPVPDNVGPNLQCPSPGKEVCCPNILQTSRNIWEHACTDRGTSVVIY